MKEEFEKLIAQAREELKKIRDDVGAEVELWRSHWEFVILRLQMMLRSHQDTANALAALPVGVADQQLQADMQNGQMAPSAADIVDQVDHDA